MAGLIQLHSHQTPHRTGTRPEIRGTQPHVGEGLEDEYSHFLVSLKGCTKQSKLWSHEQWKLLPQIVLTAVPRFFNHCTCTLYLKLPKNVLIVFSLNNMAKNWKPCLLLMGSSHRPFGKGDLHLPSCRGCTGQGGYLTPPPSLELHSLAFGKYKALLLGFHIYGFDCKIPQPSSPRDN